MQILSSLCFVLSPALQAAGATYALGKCLKCRLQSNNRRADLRMVSFLPQLTIGFKFPFSVINMVKNGLKGDLLLYSITDSTSGVTNAGKKVKTSAKRIKPTVIASFLSLSITATKCLA